MADRLPLRWHHPAPWLFSFGALSHPETARAVVVLLDDCDEPVPGAEVVRVPGAWRVVGSSVAALLDIACAKPGWWWAVIPDAKWVVGPFQACEQAQAAAKVVLESVCSPMAESAREAAHD